jgi:hypothetical protein
MCNRILSFQPQRLRTSLTKQCEYLVDNIGYSLDEIEYLIFTDELDDSRKVDIVVVVDTNLAFLNNV